MSTGMGSLICSAQRGLLLWYSTKEWYSSPPGSPAPAATGMRAARWRRSYIGGYFLFKAEAAQETTGAACHRAAPERGNTQERPSALIWDLPVDIQHVDGDLYVPGDAFPALLKLAFLQRDVKVIPHLSCGDRELNVRQLGQAHVHLLLEAESSWCKALWSDEDKERGRGHKSVLARRWGPAGGAASSSE
ncbi:hypothetical protein EYF80_023440 [Liparis tanakae]|uniref:Uncharacterized protein n=1 Tax=Liparis tanakae TaxID=230148 RepID=A0A4Z2HMX5_9TELE|nr:hypothetical protein EYF80_023440 [Liparis tanakae]